MEFIRYILNLHLIKKIRMILDFDLTAKTMLCSKLKNIGINTMLESVKYISNLPYGRTSNRNDLTLIIDEQKGTCSSKHAALKQLDLDHGFDNFELVIGLYKMNAKNTKGIEPVLRQNKLDWIPEAHCYLRKDDERMDITFSNNGQFHLSSFILEEEAINPDQIGVYKVEKHRAFLRKWNNENKTGYSFEQLWSIREACIKALESS